MERSIAVYLSFPFGSCICKSHELEQEDAGSRLLSPSSFRGLYDDLPSYPDQLLLQETEVVDCSALELELVSEA